MDKHRLVESTKPNKRPKYSQLWLLVKKNLLLQKRSPLSATIELIIPAIFVIILLPIRTIVNSDQKTNFTTYKSYGLNMFDYPLLFNNYSFGYYPNNSDIVNNVTLTMSKKLNLDLKCGLFFIYFFYILFNIKFDSYLICFRYFSVWFREGNG